MESVMSNYYIELTPSQFRARLAAAPIAYLPLGTLEWHSEHLPLGTDGIISGGFFDALASRVGGIVLPMLFLGPDRVREDGRNPPDIAELQRRYEVSVFPTVVIAAPDGRLIAKHEGFRSPQALAEFLAEAAGVPQSVVARAEAHPDRTRVEVLAHLLATMNHRLTVVANDGTELTAENEPSAELRDAAGRRYPPHLDVVSTSEGGIWWGSRFWMPCERKPPEYTFRRERFWRDAARERAESQAASRDTAEADGARAGEPTETRGT